MKIEIVYSKKNQKVIKIDDVYLNSKYNTSIEAKKFIDGYKHVLNDEIIHVLGLGLGYHIKELLKITNNKKIKIYILNTEVYNTLKNEIEVKEIINNKNIEIYFENEIDEYFKTIKKSNDIIIYRPLLKFAENVEIKNKIENYIIAKSGIKKFSIFMEENKLYNESKNYKSISKFLSNKRKKIKLVASAGPSLDMVVNDIKKYRSNYDIYAVGSAVSTLIKNDIYPDAIVIIDSQKIVANQLYGYNDLDIPLLFLATASRWAVDNYSGPKYIFYNEDNKENIIIETGKTVAIATIDIAIKSEGEKIILVGQDLAYVNNKTHSKAYEEMYEEKDEILGKDKAIKIKDVVGYEILTNRGYILFKENIEKLIKDNNKIKFYNCSLGAEIKGAKFTTMKKLFEGDEIND